MTLLFSAVLVRFKNVQIIPVSETTRMDKWVKVRKASLDQANKGEDIRDRDARARNAAVALQDAEPWRPLVMGNPMHKTRRVNILEMGAMTRWGEIRRKNHLVDIHADLNLQAIEDAVEAVEELVGFQRIWGKPASPPPRSSSRVASPRPSIARGQDSTDGKGLRKSEQPAIEEEGEGDLEEGEEGEDGVGSDVEVEVDARNADVGADRGEDRSVEAGKG